MSEKDKSKAGTHGATRGVRIERIDAERAGQRVDNYLAATLKGVPRSRIYRLLRKGEVRVNGKRVKPRARLADGDEVRIPPVRIAERSTPTAARLGRQLLDAVVFEDSRLLVINKPPGVAVHGGSGVSSGVVEALRDARADLAALALVHRLDRETSGCLVLAKRRSALRSLHEAFREGRVTKRYLAGCVGHWAHGRLLVDEPLEVRHRRGGERHVVVAASGKAARTLFAPTSFYDGFTVVSAEPETGRTHQIRVHAAVAGFPLLGDTRYGDEAANREFAKAGLPRLFLHAQSIAFADDSGNEQLFTAPLADDLERFVSTRRRRQ